jgi:hypothetical protein
MLSLCRRAVTKSVASVGSFKPSAIAVRAFSDAHSDEGYGKRSIPMDKDFQGGRRGEELESEARGIQGFNRDPIIPTHDMGTKENPILVPSAAHTRAVGYEDPVTNQLVWFNLDEGKLHYIPDIGLYFQMSKI